MWSENKSNVKRGWVLVLAISVLHLSLWGCASQPQVGDKKEDWKKTGPPAQYHGPGQPGGPPTGASSGPATPVPAGAGSK